MQNMNRIKASRIHAELKKRSKALIELTFCWFFVLLLADVAKLRLKLRERGSWWSDLMTRFEILVVDPSSPDVIHSQRRFKVGRWRNKSSMLSIQRGRSVVVVVVVVWYCSSYNGLFVCLFFCLFQLPCLAGVLGLMISVLFFLAVEIFQLTFRWNENDEFTDLSCRWGS